MDATPAVTKRSATARRSSRSAQRAASAAALGAVWPVLIPRDPTGPAQNYGSKRTVVGAHYGLRDWLAQRITAALMALFTLALLVQLLLPGEMGYDKWAGIFTASG